MKVLKQGIKEFVPCFELYVAIHLEMKAKSN